MASRPTLIIGIGHPDRGDDAAGRVVAAALRGRVGDGVEVIETDGEAGKLLDLIDGRADVIIVDAGLSGAAPGAIHRLDATAGPMPLPMFATSSHAIGLSESIELARALGTLPKRCLVIAIEAQRFDLGAGMSPPVTAATDTVIEDLLAELASQPA
ncbi:MAG: hydrogenase maturation protease [Bauldia sp.]|nr:hydrogenase maturation protease [Bauldia sp.]